MTARVVVPIADAGVQARLALAFARAIASDDGHVAEFVSNHWWEHFLHNQTALRLKAALLFHPGVVVANVPYHMAHATV